MRDCNADGPGSRTGTGFATLIRHPVRRAVFHFISQSLFRVPRYQIYLVLYGGIGLSVVVASILRFTVAHQRLQKEFSADGILVATVIVTFWMIAGMRMAWLPIVSEPWIQMSVQHFAVAAGAIAATHVMLRLHHRGNVRLYSNMPGLEDDEEEFPMKLGLRY